MLKSKLTLVIHTCDKFSDLWDSHVKLLEQNWSNRGVRSYLVTDRKTDKEYKNVTILPTGDDYQLSQRISAMLPYIDTEYVLVTLDDYFPIYPIDGKKIERLVNIMDREKLDYIRLFKRPDSKIPLGEHKGLYRIDLHGKKDQHYQVNLYPGIWRKSFIEKTANDKLNPWEYELSLTRIAREHDLSCAMSKGKELEFLDVVRKGKLLHKAAGYLKKHDLYDGPRTVIPWSAEFKINIMTFIKDVTPQWFVDFLKKIMHKFGWTFFSDEN